jgi:ribosomal protein L35AE/L33A
MCCAVLVGACLIGSAVSATNATPASKVYTVTIENMLFNPQKLTVRVGDRVVWVNKETHSRILRPRGRRHLIRVRLPRTLPGFTLPIMQATIATDAPFIRP